MKARLLPTGEFAEYGKTDTVVLIATLNSTEAGRILDTLADSIRGSAEKAPEAVRYLVGILETIAYREGDAHRDAVNTDGRILPAEAAQRSLSRNEIETLRGEPWGR